MRPLGLNDPRDVLVAQMRRDVAGVKARGDQRWMYVTPTTPVSSGSLPDYRSGDSQYPVFENGWGNIGVDADGNNLPAASFRLHAGGIQIIMAVTGGESTPGSTIFTIPATYPRPSKSFRQLVVIGADGTGIGTISVNPDGTVVFVNETTGAQGPTGATGPAGADGAAWYVGTGAPSSGLGTDGDFYLDSFANDIYKKASAVWTVVANLNGTPGATWYSGSGAPSSGSGVDGDFYLNTATEDVYKKTSGTWSITTNIKGATGATGATGAGVPNGGTANQVLAKIDSVDQNTYWMTVTGGTGTGIGVWTSGSGVPSNSVGSDGDFYYRTDTGGLYKRISGAYSLQQILVPAGGSTGQVLTKTSSSDYAYAWSAPTGGTTIRDGSGVPSNSLGANGDYYFDDSTGDLYLRASGTYSKVMAGARVGDLLITINGNGSVISTGVKGDIPVDFDGTFLQWTLLGDVSGSIQLDIWKTGYSTFPPTGANTITGTDKPVLSAGTKGQSSALTGWTTTFSAGDVLRVNVDSCTTTTRATLAIKVRRR